MLAAVSALAACSFIGANEAYLPELGRYDYRLEDTSVVVGTLNITSADGSGINYLWEVPAFPASTVPFSAQYTGGIYRLRGRLAATDELVTHDFGRDGADYSCTARITADGGQRQRTAGCTIRYRGR
jgi:hypothetical protein